MPLADYISGNDDDRLNDVSAFLSGRWQEVIDEEPVFTLRTDSESPVWTCESFEVHKVKVGPVIEAAFAFKARGLDDKSRYTGEKISGSALVLIDDYDTVEFTEVSAELESA
jgi:hypothetical protein